MLRVWWLWLPLGAALLVYAVATGAALLARGGPLIIGLILLVWGVGGARVAFRQRA